MHPDGDRAAADVVARASALLAQVTCSQQLAQVRHSWELEPQGKCSRWLGGWRCGWQAGTPLPVHTHTLHKMNESRRKKTHEYCHIQMLEYIYSAYPFTDVQQYVHGDAQLQTFSLRKVNFLHHSSHSFHHSLAVFCVHLCVCVCMFCFGLTVWKCISLFTAWGLISCRSCWLVPLTSGLKRDRQAGR